MLNSCMDPYVALMLRNVYFLFFLLRSRSPVRQARREKGSRVGATMKTNTTRAPLGEEEEEDEMLENNSQVVEVSGEIFGSTSGCGFNLERTKLVVDEPFGGRL